MGKFLMQYVKKIRHLLDGLYLVSGVAAAFCLIAILFLIVVQMLARWTGEMFPGAPNYAGYAMAAASFLAFANALNHGAHIRVSIVLNAVSPFWNRIINTACFMVGTAVAWYFVYYATRFTFWSWKFHEVSQGQDATALWIPQSAMVVGAIVLAIALTDNLLHLLLRGEDRVIKSDLGSASE